MNLSLLFREYASLSIIAILLCSLFTLSVFQPHGATAAKPVVVKNYQICEIPDGSSSGDATCVNDLTLAASQISADSVKVYVNSDQLNLCTASGTTTCSNSFNFTLSEVSASKVKIKIKTDQLNLCSDTTTDGSSSGATTCTNVLTLTLSLLGDNPLKIKIKIDSDQLNLCTGSGTTTCSNSYTIVII
jgi:hypothetical protein